MIRKLSLFLTSIVAASSLHAQSNYDMSLKYGLTSIDNADGLNFKNHTLSGDVSFDVGYALKPRLGLAYVMIDDKDKWGGVSTLLQTALSAQYSKEFTIGDLAHELYIFGGLGYEYVVDGTDTFDSLPFFQGGFGAKYALNKSVKLVGEFKALQVFDSNNNSDDEDNEFSVMIGLNFPFGGAVVSPKKKVVMNLDSDKDGVKDKIDLCANTPAGAKVDASGCSIEPVVKEVVILDSDKDGVPDDRDDCPNTKLNENMRVSERGCPIITLLDSDNDGVTDDIDTCPNTKEGAKVDVNGCIGNINLGINFETNSAVIKKESISKIKEFASHIKNMSDGTIVTIYGYTDSSGNAQKNRELSSKRAFAVRKALLAEGLEKRFVRAYGKGSTNPIADNATPEGRAQNRRIEASIRH